MICVGFLTFVATVVVETLAGLSSYPVPSSRAGSKLVVDVPPLRWECNVKMDVAREGW